MNNSKSDMSDEEVLTISYDKYKDKNGPKAQKVLTMIECCKAFSRIIKKIIENEKTK